MYTLSWKRYSLMAVASFSRIMCCATMQKWVRKDHIKFEVLTSKFPRSQSNWASVGCAGQTSLTDGVPTSQLTGLKGSTWGRCYSIWLLHLILVFMPSPSVFLSEMLRWLNTPSHTASCSVWAMQPKRLIPPFSYFVHCHELQHVYSPSVLLSNALAMAVPLMHATQLLSFWS